MCTQYFPFFCSMHACACSSTYCFGCVTISLSLFPQHTHTHTLTHTLTHTQLLPTSCDQQVIVWLTQRLTNWKFIARWLGLQENEISRIMADNPLSDREQCYQMFLRWRETDPENYTYPVLGQALKKESLELYNEYVREVHHVENSTELNTQQST